MNRGLTSTCKQFQDVCNVDDSLLQSSAVFATCLQWLIAFVCELEALGQSKCQQQSILWESQCAVVPTANKYGECKQLARCQNVQTTTMYESSCHNVQTTTMCATHHADRATCMLCHCHVPQCANHDHVRRIMPSVQPAYYVMLTRRPILLKSTTHRFAATGDDLCRTNHAILRCI